jgi:hypothetical protein
MAEATLDSLFAAAEDAISKAHCCEAQLFFKLTVPLFVRSKSPAIFGMPVTEQDILGVATNPLYQGMKCYFDPIEYSFDGDFENSIGTW